MVINYLGGECFKVTFGDLTIAINPPGKSSKFSTSKFGADIALVSLPHADFNGVENAAFGEREPFVVKGAGEYEIKGVAIRGFGAPTTYDGEATINTIYSVSLEGMNLCFLGAMGSADLPTSAKQELDEVDILFVPVGGGDVMDHAAAYKLAVGLEPKVIIPMHYDDKSLKAFLKEAGAEGVKPEDKLTVKRKDLEGKQAEVVVLGA